MKYPHELHRGRMGRRASRRRRRFGRIKLTMALAVIFAGLGWAAWPMLTDEIGDVIAAVTEAVPSDRRTESRRPASLLTGREGKPAAAIRTRFTLCHTGGGTNCVVDGDTFWIDGVKIRIADVDTPETHPARCAREAELGHAATRRLHALLNSGEVTLASIGRDADRYGRKLRLVSVDGRGVGDALVAEGLARRYAGGGREGWCG